MNLLVLVKGYFNEFLRRKNSFINSKAIAKRNQMLALCKNKYEGQRCFIIGNGPSLKIEDLEALKDEVTFASHGIYYIYDNTDWRPTFYCAQDAKLINERYCEIKEKCKESINVFGIVKNRNYVKFSEDSIIINLIDEDFVDGYPKFSDDLTFGAYEGLTVTYFNIQLAIYMGFKEIYLLGVDHFYSGGRNDHFSEQDVCTNVPQTEKSTFSYIKAKDFANEKGVKIYNATRGGHLEVFERVDFDDVLRR